jgi:hypothetical protein
MEYDVTQMLSAIVRAATSGRAGDPLDESVQ